MKTNNDNIILDIDNLSEKIITQKRLLSRNQKAKLKPFLHKILFSVIKILIAYRVISEYPSLNILLILGMLILICVSLIGDIYFVFNMHKLSNLFSLTTDLQHRRIVLERMRTVDIFIDFACMLMILIQNNAYTTINLLIIICLTIILYSDIMSNGLKTLEKRLFSNRILSIDYDKSRGYFWDIIFPKGRPIIYFRILSLVKIILLALYIFVFYYEIQFFSYVRNTPFLFAFIIKYIIILINIWWFSLYSIRIWTINISKDSPSEIEEKRKVLLLMERFEWVVSLTIFPILVFIEVSLTNYIYNGETNFIQVLTDMKDELPNYISTSLIGYVFYLFNLRSIKSLHRDVKTNYSLITLNPLRSWKKIEI